MRFTTALVALCAVVSGVQAQATPAEQIVQAFKEITTLSNDLRIETQKINLINAPLQGYKIGQGFFGIITRVTEAVSMLAGSTSAKRDLPVGKRNVAEVVKTLKARQTGPLTDPEAQTVVTALTTFVQVHQALLNVVIGKHGLLTLIPFFEPIRVSLVELERTVDTFAFYLIALIPTQEPEAKQQFGSLGATVEQAISTYEQPL